MSERKRKVYRNDSTTACGYLKTRKQYEVAFGKKGRIIHTLCRLPERLSLLVFMVRLIPGAFLVVPYADRESRTVDVTVPV